MRRPGTLRAELVDHDCLELELRRSGGRQARRNGKLLDRQLDLIGPLRCIGFSALDLELVRGEPALRRQWLDRVVLQLEPIYADLISRYSRLLRQRSQLWKRIATMRTKNAGLLDAFDLQMALMSTRIHRRRRRALASTGAIGAVNGRPISVENRTLPKRWSCDIEPWQRLAPSRRTRLTRTMAVGHRGSPAETATP